MTILRPMDLKKFSDRLIELRIEKNLTQLQLAKELGIDSTTISKWESCQRIPKGDGIVLLARYFKVTAGYLLGIED